MAAPVDVERATRTPEQQEALRERIVLLKVQEDNIKAQIADLETRRGPLRTEQSRTAHELYTAELIDNPIICEPHGVECIQESPSAMSANANIHIEDGATCYAASIGRRNDFTPEELEIYRRIKKGKR